MCATEIILFVVLSKRYAHLGWHIGLKKTGNDKNGRRTWYPWGQKAIRFVARRPYPQPHPLKQITNRHGLTLTLMADGSVRGLALGPGDADGRSSALLEFIPSVPPGAFRLRGVVTNLYLAMNDKGQLYGEPDYEDEATMFVQHAHVSHMHNSLFHIVRSFEDYIAEYSNPCLVCIFRDCTSFICRSNTPTMAGTLASRRMERPKEAPRPCTPLTRRPLSL